MGWDNPAVPWRELERRLSWGTGEPAQAAEPDQPRRVTRLPAPGDGPGGHGPPWAELHCHSSYSFLDGASSPAELVAEAARLGLEALAITDHDGMYGVPQFAQAAAKLTEQTGVKLGTVFGAELSLGCASPGGRSVSRGTPRTPAGPGARAGSPTRTAGICSCSPGTRTGTGGCAGRSASRSSPGARRAAPSTTSRSSPGRHDGHWVILTGCRKGAVRAALAAQGPEAARQELGQLRDAFGRDNVVVELTSHDQPEDDERNDALYELAQATGTTAIATGNVHYAAPADARLAQALAAVRARRSLDEMDGWLAASGGAYLRSGAEMAHRLRRYPGAVENTVAAGPRLRVRAST